jgi:hypothetical protein
MRAFQLLSCVALCGLFACEKPKDEPSPSAPTGAAPTTQATPSASAAAVGANNDDGEGIPTEEDFEDEAEQKITSQNAADELDKLEREISN